MLSSESTETHRYTYAGGKLLRETITETGKDKTVTTYTLDFRYDAQGAPYSLIVTTQGVSQTYYYITNLQGDVMYIVDESGDEVASYDYDPYGKLLRTTGDFAETNPIRYRGYYYDTDTDFYYLQSRYYDPTICRFINADGYTSTSQNIVSYNMYTYCGNDPINAEDSSGHIPNRAVMMTDAAPTNDLTRAMINLSNERAAEARRAEKKRRRQERSVFNKIDKYIHNTDEQVVLDAKVLAFYKGVPAIKLPIGNNAFPFGWMFIGNGAGNDVNTVRHEYGHCVQFQQMGAIKFTQYVAAPSLQGYWNDVPYDDYFSQPWEYGADMFGGVQNRTNALGTSPYPYSSTAESDWLQYWDTIMN